MKVYRYNHNKILVKVSQIIEKNNYIRYEQ